MLSESFKREFVSTDIGVIPSEWEVKRLQELAKVTGGKRLPKGNNLSQYDTGHPYIRVSDMEERGISLQSLMYVPLDVVDTIKRYRVKTSDLYISVAGTLGLVGEVPKELDGANLTENADRISEIQCDRKYLLWVLRSELIQKRIKKEQTSNAQPKLALTRIKDFLIPIPPRGEQSKIAEILSVVDETIEKTEAIIEQTEKVKKGLMQQLLTKGIGHTKFKKTEIGEIPDGWEIKELGTIGTWSGGGTPSKKEPSYWSEEKQVIWVSPKDMYSNIITSSEDFITEKGLREKKLKLLPKGTILFVTRSSILKKRVPIAVAGESLTINQDLKALQVASNIDYEFIFYALLTLNDSIRTSCVKTGTTVESIDFQSLQEVLIPIPPLSEQREIVKIIGTYYKKLENEKGYLKPLNFLKKGLMQSLLTGKVRVKVDETEVKPVCPPL